MTGWSFARASPSADSGVVVTFFRQEILNTFGLPEFVLSDNRIHFSATYVNYFARKKVSCGISYPRTIRVEMVEKERMVGTIKAALKKTCVDNQFDWEKSYHL